MREVEFIAALEALTRAPVGGLDAAGKAALLVAAGERLTAGAEPSACAIVPFVPGRRPTDEAAHPWLGSSDQAALILEHDPPGGNQAYLLLDVTRGDAAKPQLDVTLSFAGIDGSIESEPRSPAGTGARWRPGLRPARRARLVDAAIDGSARLALAISPRRDLVGDGDDPFTFANLFAQQVRVELRLCDDGRPVAAARGSLLVCDARRMGSLYERLIERLVTPDAGRQAAAANVPDPGAAYHPWYPVLLIGREKAGLYGRALDGDIVGKRRNLTDPGWLLRVGLYLEFLTFLGIAEAVRDDLGDLLDGDEREAFERSDLFAAIRDRIDPARWRAVWELRAIAFPRPGAPRTGPVAARNLLRKRTATLAFLEAHHEDLKAAVALAGPNHHNAQETWQRVFRNAERAVLRKTPAAFEELAFLPGQVRELVLWHRQGSLGVARLPGPLARLLGDQDGLFASACTQYRVDERRRVMVQGARAHGLHRQRVHPA